MKTKSTACTALSAAMADGNDHTGEASLLIHASAVRFSNKGVLLLGPSAHGKSDLALRLIDAGGVLIADDQVQLTIGSDHRLHAAPPACLRGLIELRGIGIMRVPFQEGRLDLAVELLPSTVATDHLPEPSVVSWLGLDLPKISLQADVASAVARIRMTLNAERVF